MGLRYLVGRFLLTVRLIDARNRCDELATARLERELGRLKFRLARGRRRAAH